MADSWKASRRNNRSKQCDGLGPEVVVLLLHLLHCVIWLCAGKVAQRPVEKIVRLFVFECDSFLIDLFYFPFATRSAITRFM